MDKLQTLLMQIRLEENYKDYFNNGSLDRILGSRDKTKYRFQITLENSIPLEL